MFFLQECLQNILNHSKVTAENEEPPFVETVEGVNALHAFAELTEKYLNNKGNFSSLFSSVHS